MKLDHSAADELAGLLYDVIDCALDGAIEVYPVWSLGQWTLQGEVGFGTDNVDIKVQVTASPFAGQEPIA
jgi:hypothetical protein